MKGGNQIDEGIVKKIISTLINTDHGPISEKGTALLKKIAKSNKKIA